MDTVKENGRKLALRVLDMPRIKLDDLAEVAGLAVFLEAAA